MALFVASLANVSWQGINPPGAGGDPLDYPATTFAVPVLVWSPAPVGPPEARVSPLCPVPHKCRWEVGAIVLVLILGYLRPSSDSLHGSAY